MWQHTEGTSAGEDQEAAWESFPEYFLKALSKRPLTSATDSTMVEQEESVSDQIWFCIRNKNRTVEKGNERNYLV